MKIWDRCNGQFFPRGKNGPAHPFPREKTADGAEGFDYKWSAYSKNKMSMFLIQNGYLNGLKETPPSLPHPTIWKNQFTKVVTLLQRKNNSIMIFENN